jgi:Ca-activated chloride channel family protein
VYPHGRFDLFAGDQAVLVGRYRTSGAAKVTLRGKVGDREEAFQFPADLAAKSDDDTNAFVAKLWATRRVGEIIDELDLRGKNDELIKELVDLATKHGILTPYTSFLADDTAASRDLAAATRFTEDRLAELQDAEGELAFRQREAKSTLLRAAAPASAIGGYGGAADGDFDRFAGGRMGREASEALAARGGAGVTYYDAAADEERVAENLISVGRKTFLRRGDRWVDSTVTEEEEQKAQSIERFSPEYFELVARHGKHVAAYLAIEDPVTVKLDGRVYKW